MHVSRISILSTSHLQTFTVVISIVNMPFLLTLSFIACSHCHKVCLHSITVIELICLKWLQSCVTSIQRHLCSIRVNIFKANGPLYSFSCYYVVFPCVYSHYLSLTFLYIYIKEQFFLSISNSLFLSIFYYV